MQILSQVFSLLFVFFVFILRTPASPGWFVNYDVHLGWSERCRDGKACEGAGDKYLGFDSSSAESLFLILEMIIYSVLKTKKLQKELVLTNIWQKDMRSKKKNRCLCRDLPASYSIIESSCQILVSYYQLLRTIRF